MPDTDALLRAPFTLVRSAKLGTPDDEELKLINNIAPSPLNADDVFGVPGTASTNALDSYWTRMDPKTSLRNFVRDLKAGAGLMDSHDTSRLAVGMSYWADQLAIESGKVEGVEASEEVRGRFYLLRNHNVPGSGNTEDYIKGILGGTIRKLSIGFGGPEMTITCDEDGRDIWDWDSPFWPGQVLDDGRRVTYTVRDARLYETSMVYKNATPGALIQRMQTLISDRRIGTEEAYRLSRATGHRFDVPAPQFLMGGRKPTSTEARDMDLRTLMGALLTTRAGATFSKATRDKITDLSTRTGTAATDVQAVADELAALIAANDDASTENAAYTPEQRAAIVALGADATTEKIAELKRNAEAGAKYRDEVIGGIVAARTALALQADAANGMSAEAQEAMRATLRTQPIGELLTLRELWGGQKSERFQAGHMLRIVNDGEGVRKEGAGDGEEQFISIREG